MEKAMIFSEQKQPDSNWKSILPGQFTNPLLTETYYWQ